MAEKDRILVIASGGTIVSPKKGGAAAPDEKFADAILGRAKEYFDEAGLTVTVKRPFGASGVDSSDIGPAQWVRLAAEISGQVTPDLRGVLMIHGTDTMVYTAAWLSICFAGADFPIIFTGSQQSPDDVPFDGETNLLGAAKLAASLTAGGVAVYFDWKLHNARHAHKADCEAIDAYRSVGATPVTYHDALRGNAFPACNDAVPAKYLDRIVGLSGEEISAAARKAGLCFVLPGAEPCLRGDEEIIIVVGYGTGNMPATLHRALNEIYPGRKPLVVACSQAELGLKRPRAYKNVGIGELASQGFSVYNQGAFTLEFITALVHYALLAGDTGVLAWYLTRCE